MDADAAEHRPRVRVGNGKARERVRPTGEEGTRVRLGVRLRDLIDPTRDLGLVQALDEHVDVVGRPRTERHDAVGQRRIGGNRGTTAHGD